MGSLMNILVATTDNLEEHTAGANFVLSISLALSDIGHKVSLLHPDAPDSILRRNERYSAIESIPVIWIPVRGWARVFPYFFAAKFNSLVKDDQRRFDWVLLRVVPTRSTLVAIENCRIPMATIHFEAYFSRPEVRKAAKNIALFIHNYKPEYIRGKAAQINVPTERFLHIYYNAVAPEAFSVTAAPSEIRVRYGLDRNSLILVHVSSFRCHHDFDTLLEAASMVKCRYQIVFVGTGSREEEIRSKAVANRINARFLGNRSLSEVAELLTAADLCVDPLMPFYVSDDNLRPAKLWEYLASGRPVIESIDVNLPVADWAHEHLSLVPAGDAAALAAAITDIQCHQEYWSEKAARARQWVFANHTWKQVAEEIIAAFDQPSRVKVEA
jgi:glycosyltransferase involved in cell wall biosynthesis